MLSLTLGQLIHAERQREIARELENRRLLAPPEPVAPTRVRAVRPVRSPDCQAPAGAAGSAS